MRWVLHVAAVLLVLGGSAIRVWSPGGFVVDLLSEWITLAGLVWLLLPLLLRLDRLVKRLRQQS